MQNIFKNINNTISHITLTTTLLSNPRFLIHTVNQNDYKRWKMNMLRIVTLCKNKHKGLRQIQNWGVNGTLVICFIIYNIFGIIKVWAIKHSDHNIKQISPLRHLGQQPLFKLSREKIIQRWCLISEEHVTSKVNYSLHTFLSNDVSSGIVDLLVSEISPSFLVS